MALNIARWCIRDLLAFSKNRNWVVASGALKSRQVTELEIQRGVEFQDVLTSVDSKRRERFGALRVEVLLYL